MKSHYVKIRNLNLKKLTTKAYNEFVRNGNSSQISKLKATDILYNEGTLTMTNTKLSSTNYDWLAIDDTEYYHLPDEEGTDLEKSFIQKVENNPEYAKNGKIL